MEAAARRADVNYWRACCDRVDYTSINFSHLLLANDLLLCSDSGVDELSAIAYTYRGSHKNRIILKYCSFCIWWRQKGYSPNCSLLFL